MSLPIGLQLYTVRDELAKDFEGTIEQVAAIGYEVVEFAGFYDRSADQVRSLLDRLGLKASSAHLPIQTLDAGLDQAITDAQTIGYKNLVCPFVGDEFRSVEGYKKLARILDQAADKVSIDGLRVAYHNHDFEFAPLDGGKRGMDLIYNTTSRLVAAELDVYWVQKGGDDPLAWMSQLDGRLPLLHIKDMHDDETRSFAEVGTGIIDMASIIKKAPTIGVEYLLVEQDSNWATSPLDSARTSFNNLKQIVAANL